MFVAFDARKDLAVVRVDMTGFAGIPFVLMRSRKNGEELGIMLTKFGFLSGRVALVAIHAIECISGNALMFGIHLGLPVLMTFHTGEHLAVVRVNVAGFAFIPLVFMLTGKNREELRIVGAEVSFLSGGMALVAVLAVISVSGNALMLAVHFGLPVFVARQAGELLFVGGARVTGTAVAPGVLMHSRKHRKKQRIVIGHRCRFPPVHLMALIAVGRKAERHVIRGAGVQVLLLMAVFAARGGHGKIARGQTAVAALTIHKTVFAHERKTGSRVNFFGIEYGPAARGVAALAIGPQLGLVHVLMAGNAVFADFRKIFHNVAGQAF